MKRMCNCDKSIVQYGPYRFRRKNADGKNEPDPNKGTGFVLLDKPDHAKRRK